MAKKNLEQRWYVVDYRTGRAISAGYLTEGEAQALAKSITASDPYLLVKVEAR